MPSFRSNRLSLLSSCCSLLKDSVCALYSLHEHVLVGAVGKNLIHWFLKDHSSDLASFSGVVLLNEWINVISKHLLFISLSLATEMTSIDVNEWNNLSWKRLTEELSLCHLIDSAYVGRLLRDLELNEALGEHENRKRIWVEVYTYPIKAWESLVVHVEIGAGLRWNVCTLMLTTLSVLVASTTATSTSLGSSGCLLRNNKILIIIYSLRRMLLGVLLVAIWWEFGFSTILTLLLLLLLWLMLLRALRLLIGRMRHIWSCVGPLVGLEMLLGGGTTMAATMMIMLIALLTTTAITTVLLSVILSLWVATTTLVHHSTTIHLIAATRESGPEVEELPKTQKGVSQAFVGVRLWMNCISIKTLILTWEDQSFIYRAR